MPFGLRTRVGPGNHLLGGDPDPQWKGAILRRERGETLCGHLCKKRLNRSRYRLGCGFGWAKGVKKPDHTKLIRMIDNHVWATVVTEAQKPFQVILNGSLWKVQMFCHQRLDFIHVVDYWKFNSALSCTLHACMCDMFHVGPIYDTFYNQVRYNVAFRYISCSL